MRLGLIPARGGSKRIPRKNVKPFFGRPIIAYSIETALASRNIDRVIVSTDDEEIAAVARAAGADIPFMRTPDLSDDHATTLAVIADAINRVEAEGVTVDAVCCLYATAPFVTAYDLDTAYSLLDGSDTSYVFAATDYAYPIQRALRLRNGRPQMFNPDLASTRSQDLEPAYHDAGQFYWCRPDAVRANRPVLGPDAALYHVDRSRVVDIDTPEDWQIAEELYRLRFAGLGS